MLFNRSVCRIGLWIGAMVLCAGRAQSQPTSQVTTSKIVVKFPAQGLTITALTLSATASFTATPPFPAGLSPITFSDIILTKAIDDTTVLLYGHLFTQQVLGTAVISVFNGNNTEVQRITLRDFLVTSISEAEAPSTVPAERVTLTWSQMQISDPVTSVSRCYDRVHFSTSCSL
jgi:hypothetical protein